MSESSSSNPPPVSSQRQRWIKYGGNVALTCVIVIALAVMVTYAAGRHPIRIDTTTEGLYSLKPQTVRIIQDIKSPIRIVSLYTQTKPPQSPDEDDQSQQSIVPQDEAAQTVNDLLDEYANKGKNITVETIDPVTSPGKVDDLVQDVESKYGGEIQKYKKFVDSFKDTIKGISDIADPDAQKIETMIPIIQQVQNQGLLTTMQEVVLTVKQFPSSLTDLQDSLQRPLSQKPPDYKGASDAITESLGQMSDVLGAVINNFGVLQTQGGLPDPIMLYMKGTLPDFQRMKDIVDASLTQAKGLGELKLDTLRSALRERNTILVMGGTEWRAITYEQVWQPPGRMAVEAESNARPRFAGEQQITAAILGLTSGGTKPKVCFVRAGGSPLTSSESFMGGPDAPLSDAAARLALYNYDVTEKDLTGAFAQQSGGTEPSDDDIKDATWVVWGFSSGQQSQFGPPPSIAPQVAAHLKQGGSAVILTGYKQDPMAEALADWGIEVNVNAMIVHQAAQPNGANAADLLQQALGKPYIFALSEYGNHPLAKPLGSLDSVFVPMAPVIIHPTTGYQATPLLPIPTAPEALPSWASTTFDPNGPNPNKVTYDPLTDIAGPLFGGAAVEKNGGGRVVVFAAGAFPIDDYLRLTSDEFDRSAAPVVLFPGNGELFTNSVFWASRQDTLIDISPAAMDVGRIKDITPAMQKFWRVGVLMIGLPGLVLLTGAGVYLKRRD